MLTREQFETIYGPVSDAAFAGIVELQLNIAALQEHGRGVFGDLEVRP